MENKKDDQDLPQRHSLRLPGYDYSLTATYFFTINAQKRRRFFDSAELYTSLLENWQALPVRFPGVILDEFVIMAEDDHGIFWLDQLLKHTPTLSAIFAAYQTIPTID